MDQERHLKDTTTKDNCRGQFRGTEGYQGILGQLGGTLFLVNIMQQQDEKVYPERKSRGNKRVVCLFVCLCLCLEREGDVVTGVGICVRA